MQHKPVLLKEVLEYLDPKPGEFAIDGTINGGGHANAILEKIMPEGKFLGTDLDSAMIEKTNKRISAIPDYQSLVLKQIFLLHGNYADLPEILKNKTLGRADMLLLDLGFSSEQLKNSGRGFSFMENEPLLMTYDKNRPPVKELLRGLKEEEIEKIIFELSGEKFARRIARAIKSAERKGSIETTSELAEIIRGAVPKHYERGRIDPATRTFQALRIYANDEIVSLKKILGGLMEILKPGGRVAIISFHSLEDRIVKENFKNMEKGGELRILTKKPVTPSPEEVRDNPQSRSAKLRAAQIINKI